MSRRPGAAVPGKGADSGTLIIPSFSNLDLNAIQPDIAAAKDKRKAISVDDESSEETRQFEERAADIFRALSVVFADDGVNQSLTDVRAMLSAQPGLFQASGESEADVNRMLAARTQELEGALNVVRAANKAVCPKNATSALKLVRSLTAHIIAAAHTPPSRISALSGLPQYMQHKDSIDKAIETVKGAVMAFKTRKTLMDGAAGPSDAPPDDPMPDPEVTDADYKAFEAESSILYLRGMCDVVPNSQRGPVVRIIQDHIDLELVPEPTCNLLADLLKLIHLMCIRYTDPESTAYEMVFANTNGVNRPDTRFLSNAKPKSLMPSDRSLVGQEETFIEHIIGDLKAGSSQYSTELARVLWEELSKSINARPSTELTKNDVAPYIHHEYDDLDSDRETPPDTEITEWDQAFTQYTNSNGYSESQLLDLKNQYIRVFLRYARYTRDGSWFANSAAMVSCMVSLSSRLRWTETQIATEQREVANKAVAIVYPSGAPSGVVEATQQQLQVEASLPIKEQVSNYEASQETGGTSPPDANSGGQVNGDGDDRGPSPSLLDLPDAVEDAEESGGQGSDSEDATSTKASALKQMLTANNAEASQMALARDDPIPAATRQLTAEKAAQFAPPEDTSGLLNEESAASREQARQVQEAAVALSTMQRALDQSEQRLKESGTELGERQRELEKEKERAESLDGEIKGLQERLEETNAQKEQATAAARAAAAQALSMQNDADSTTSKLGQVTTVLKTLKGMLTGREKTIEELQEQIIAQQKELTEAKNSTRKAEKQVAREQTFLDDALKQSINELREQCNKQVDLLTRRRTSSPGEIAHEREEAASKFKDYSNKLKRIMRPSKFSLDNKREVEVIRKAIKKLTEEVNDSNMSQASNNLDAVLEYIANACETLAETSQADSRNLSISTTIQHAVAVLSIMSADTWEEGYYYVGANTVHWIVAHYAKQPDGKQHKLAGRLGSYVMLYRSAWLFMTQHRASNQYAVSSPLFRMLPIVAREALMRALGIENPYTTRLNNDYWNFFLTISLTAALNYSSFDFLYQHVMRHGTGQMVIGRTLQVVGASMAELISIAHTYDQVQRIVNIVYVNNRNGHPNQRALIQWGRLLWVNRSGPTRVVLTLSMAIALFYYPQLKKKLLRGAVKALRAAKRLRPTPEVLLVTGSPEALRGAGDATSQGGSSSEDTGGNEVPMLDFQSEDEEDGEEDGQEMRAAVESYMDTLVGRRITNQQLGTFTVVSKAQRRRGSVDVCAVLAVLHHTDVHSLCLR